MSYNVQRQRHPELTGMLWWKKVTEYPWVRTRGEYPTVVEAQSAMEQAYARNLGMWIWDHEWTRYTYRIVDEQGVEQELDTRPKLLS